MSEVKSRTWTMEADTVVLYKNVVFDEPLTREEAIDRFLEGDYEDILDEEQLAVTYVKSAEPEDDEEYNVDEEETDE